MLKEASFFDQNVIFLAYPVEIFDLKIEVNFINISYIAKKQAIRYFWHTL